MSRRAMRIVGIVLIAAGGALLAFGGDLMGAPVGTVFALAGVGLVAWSILQRDGDAGS